MGNKKKIQMLNHLVMKGRGAWPPGFSCKFGHTTPIRFELSAPIPRPLKQASSSLG
jgi:hypothetical protein